MLLYDVSHNLVMEAALRRRVLTKLLSQVQFMVNLSSNDAIRSLSLENISALYTEWKTFAQAHADLIPMGNRTLCDYTEFKAPEIDYTKALLLLEDLATEPEFFNQVRRRATHRWYTTRPEEYSVEQFAQFSEAFDEGLEHHPGVTELMKLLQMVSLEILVIEGLV